MQYVCVDPVEFLYTDTKEYKSGTDRINILTPRGSYACAQILLTECSDSIEVSCDGWYPEIYEMVAIHVEANPMYSWNNAAPHTPEKKAPFEVYDCLKPYCGSITPKNGQTAVYFSMQIPKDFPVGVINGSVTVNGISIPVTVEVSSAIVPDETLSVVMWYSKENIRKYHGLESGSQDLDDMETEYFKLMRRQHQNGTGISVRPKITDVGKDLYEFDFSDMENENIKTPVKTAHKSWSINYLGIFPEQRVYELSKGETVDVEMHSADTSLDCKKISKGVTLSGFDESIISADGTKITGVSEGETFVTAEWKGYKAEFIVRVS